MRCHAKSDLFRWLTLGFVLMLTPGIAAAADPPYRVDLDSQDPSSVTGGISLSAHNCGDPGNALLNCGYESGSFPPEWGTQDLTAPFYPLSIFPAGAGPGFGFFLSAPTEGQLAALHGWDGNGPGTIKIWQDLVLPPIDSVLQFDYRAAWDMFNFGGSTLPRTFDVTIEPAGGGAPILGPVTFLTAPPNSVEFDTGDLSGSMSINGLGGAAVRVSFNWFVPEPSTGPAFFQLDNAEIRVPAVCGDLVVDSPETCDPPGSSVCNCCQPHGGLGCDDSVCEAAICAFDPFCCTTAWDNTCAIEAQAQPECQECCNASCRGDCTYCGDGVVNGGAAELLINGDFEAGTLVGWSTAELDINGAFTISTPGAITPLGFNPTSGNPGGGLFYALGDMAGPETLALWQTFTVPPSTTQVLLSFEMFVDDWDGGGGTIDPIGLDHTGPPNQHARVDLLTPGAPPFDTGASVLANYYVGVDPAFPPNPYTPYVIDITGDVVPGGTYTLRFATTLNVFYLHQGVDNVSIVATGGLEQCDDGNFVIGDGCDHCEGTDVCEGQPPSTPCPDVDGNDCTIAGCDGMGFCNQEHFFVEPSFPCDPGQPFDPQCTIPGCDGLGFCDPFHVTAPPSEPCDPGVPFDPQCTDPGCDGFGFCDPLHLPAPPSFPCQDIDGNECTEAGCDGLGVCQQLHMLPVSDPCSEDDGNVCTISGCDGMGNCDTHHILPASDPCPADDGNECTISGCDGQGNCNVTHILVEPSTPCDPDEPFDPQCTMPGCDGMGFCDPLHLPAPPSQPCDPQGPFDSQCTTPGCDGFGFCNPLHIPDPPSTPCPDMDGNECTVAGCDGMGFCEQFHILPTSEPCSDDDGNECTISGCDGQGGCDPLHIFVDPSSPCDPEIPYDPDCTTPGCDGMGFCNPLHIPTPPSEPCMDADGNECTLAGCDGMGSCNQSHILPESNPCGNGSLDGECNVAGCDGQGDCDPLHVVIDESTPCGDADFNDCTISGCTGTDAVCDQEHLYKPVGEPCDDGTGTCDGMGTCIHEGGEPCFVRLFAAFHADNNAPSTLVELDPNTGAPLAVIGPIGFNTVGGMDFHPTTGVLYGVGKRPADSTWVLIEIDPISGLGVEIGPLVNTSSPSGGSHFDVSFRSDGTLFLTAFSPINPCISLFTIDLASGLATEVGDTFTCNPGNAIGYDWGDTLYQTNNDIAPLGGQGTEWIVNDLTGASAPLNPLSYAGFPPLNNPVTRAMDFDPATGVAYVSVNDSVGGGGPPGPTYLGTLNEITGVVTFVGQTFDGLDPLAWQADCDDDDPCTIDVCEHCVPDQNQPPFDVLTVDCTPFVSPGTTSFGPSNTMGMSLQMVDPGGLFNVTEVTPQTFRALTAAQLAQFDLIAINNHPARISDNCIPGSAGLGTTWHGVIGVNSGGRVHLNSHDLARFKIIIPPGSTPFGAAGGPCPNCEPFAADDLLLQSATWAAGGTQTGLVIFNDSARFSTVGGVGWDNPELNLPAAWGINDSDQTFGTPTDGGHTDILPAFAGHPIYLGLNDQRLQPNSVASFAANIADGSYHSVFAGFDPTIFTPTEEVINAGILDVGGYNAAFGVGAFNAVNGPDGLAVSLIRDDNASGDCDPGPVYELYGTAHVGPVTPSTLYRIDPANGNPTPIGPIGFLHVGDIDFDPTTGILYGVGVRPADGTPVLITIDPATAIGTEVGPLTVPAQTQWDVSFRSDGMLFMTSAGTGSCVALWQVNKATGFSVELPGVPGTGTCAPGNALGYDLADTLFHMDVNPIVGGLGTLYITNDAIGVSNPHQPLGYVGFPGLTNPRPNALDFHVGDGVAYVGVNDSPGPGMGPNFLATMDTASGIVTHIGPTSNGLAGLAWRVVAGVHSGVCVHIPEPDLDDDGLCDPIDPCPADPDLGFGLSGFQTIFALGTKTDFVWANPTNYLFVRGNFTISTHVGSYAVTAGGSGFGASRFDPAMPVAGGSVNGLWYLFAPDCFPWTWESGGPSELLCVPPQNPSDCCAAHATPGCSHPVCESIVCSINPNCCTSGWDPGCAAMAPGFPECMQSCMGIQCRDGVLP